MTMIFKVGDRVICNDEYNDNAYGIIIVDIPERIKNYGVNISTKDLILSDGTTVRRKHSGHNLSGNINTSTGRWFKAENMKLFTPPEWDEDNNE